MRQHLENGKRYVHTITTSDYNTKSHNALSTGTKIDDLG